MKTPYENFPGVGYSGTLGTDNINLNAAEFVGVTKAKGRDGDDALLGDEENNWLGGDAGNDFLAGEGGSDELYGGAGFDMILGDGRLANALPDHVPGDDHIETDGGV
ncbi:hypothetical protein DRV85_18385, partial [Rhodosalinus halophilus]